MKPAFTSLVALLQVITFLLLLSAVSASAQSAPIWTGSISCQLDDEEQGVYQRQEIQTWTLTGAPPDNPQSMPIYQATWQAQAQGQLLRVQSTQTTSIQWVANVPSPGGQAPSVPIAIHVRASDGRLVIGQWRSSTSAPNALNGQRQVFVNGVPQGQPVPFSRALQEWKFPLIEASATDSTISGTSQTQADAGTAEIVHRYGSLPPAATCQWKLTKGGSGGQSSTQGAMGTPNPNQQNSSGSFLMQNNNPTGMSGGTQNSNPPGTQSGTPNTPASNPNCDSPAVVQQSFEAMKANLKSSYDTLIQATTDQAQIAALTQQEQKTLANLTAQEQHDMQKAAADGCTGGGQAGSSQSSTNPPTGSNPAGGGQSSTANSGSSTPSVTPSPTNVTATAGDRTATLSWTAPTLAPGDSVAVYRISSVPGGVQTTSHTGPVTLTGLTNGTTYTFQVFAIPTLGGTPAISQPGVSNPVTPIANGGLASIQSISPDQATCNLPITSFVLTGQNTHFAQGTTTVDFGPGVQPRAVNVAGQTVYAHMFIDNTATAGLHTVTVTTGNEVVKTAFTVNTPCLPDPPANVVATAGNASAVVSWTSPGGPVTSYTVQPLADHAISPGPGTTVATTQATVTGLTNGTPYAFLVTASTATGLTSTPATSNQVTPTSASASSGGGSSGIPMATQTPNHVISMGLLIGASPATNNGQQNVTVTLTGQSTNFMDGSTTVSFVRTSQPGSTVKAPNAAVLSNLSNSGPPPLQVGSVKVNSKTSATVTLSINPTAGAGTYTITATTPTASGSELVTLNNGFTVTPTPALSNVNVIPTPATLNVAPASGSYLVTVTSLRCGRETLDDPLQMDGKGDEIYASAFIRRYDRRSSQLLESTHQDTLVYGDANQAPSRIQSGTRSALGGIQDSDIIPDYPNNASVERGTVPPKDNMFPLKLWQGTLTDGVDALIISPSIWESDNDNTVFMNWLENQSHLNPNLISAQVVQNQIKNNAFGTITVGNLSGTSTNDPLQAIGISVAEATFGIPAGILPLNTPKDRPIGLVPNDANSTALPHTAVVLTREIIEAALKGPSPTVFPYFDPKVMKIPQTILMPKPGIMVIVFTDTAKTIAGNAPTFVPDGPASYAMILQVERR